MSVRQLIIRVRTSFWYLPTVYGGIAFILAIKSMLLDRYLARHSYYPLIPDVFFSDIDLAQTILSSLLTSLLTMTTITFSSILVVLTTYLSNLASPFHYDQLHQLRVIFEKPSFDDYLYKCFYQIRHYAKTYL